MSQTHNLCTQTGKPIIKNMLLELIEIAEDMDSGSEDLRLSAHQRLSDLKRSGLLWRSKQDAKADSDG